MNYFDKYFSIEPHESRAGQYSGRFQTIDVHRRTSPDRNSEGDLSERHADNMPSKSPMVSPLKRRYNEYASKQLVLVSPMELERRRKHMGLCSLKQNHVGILSHTIFIGHLHKQFAESRLRSLCAELTEGEVIECNFIPPRGCAFVTFATRRSAYRAVTQMDHSTVNGRNIKVAWAPNFGIKSREKYLSKYWDLDEGCTYLPFAEVLKLSRSQFDELLAGHGELDVDSVNEERVRHVVFGKPSSHKSHSNESTTCRSMKTSTVALNTINTNLTISQKVPSTNTYSKTNSSLLTVNSVSVPVQSAVLSSIPAMISNQSGMFSSLSNLFFIDL